MGIRAAQIARFKQVLIVAFVGLLAAVLNWELCSLFEAHAVNFAYPGYLFCFVIVLFGTVLFDVVDTGISRRVREVPPTLLISIAAVLLLAFVPLGMWQFGGFDQSALILSGWYMRVGKIPYRDASYTLPPLFYLGAGWAFRVFGLQWWAMIAAAGVFAIATFLWLVAMFRTAGMSVAAAVAVAFTSEVATVLVGAYWWYNPVSAIAVVLLFAASLAALYLPASRLAWTSVAGSIGLLLLSKPNSWPALGCAGVLLLSRDGKTRLRAVLAIACGAALAAMICTLHGFSAADVLRSYARIAASRGAPDLLAGAGWSLPLLAFAIFIFGAFASLLIADASEWHAHWREYECCAAAALASIWMAFTDFEIKTSDLMPIVAVVVTIALRPWSARPIEPRRRRFVGTLLLTITICSSYWAMTRVRVRGIGEGMFFELPASVKHERGFFAGMRTGPRFASVLQQMDDALRRHPGNVFFGPRMEFGYALFQLPPANGMPLFWQAGSAYELGDTPRIVASFGADDFATLIFLKDKSRVERRAFDLQRLPGALLVEISRDYDRVDDYPDLTVFVRKLAGAKGTPSQ